MIDFVHHLVHLLIYSLIIWQVVLGVYIILIWASKNFKFHRSPVLNIGESSQGGSPIGESKVKKDLGPVEVDVKKNFSVDTKLDEQSVKLDEKINSELISKIAELEEIQTVNQLEI